MSVIRWIRHTTGTWHAVEVTRAPWGVLRPRRSEEAPRPRLSLCTLAPFSDSRLAVPQPSGRACMHCLRIADRHAATRLLYEVGLTREVRT
jgi:hypothetical protein